MQLSSIKSWAEEDRPREKLSLKGRNALTDAELLAILLGSGSAKKSAVELAREILNHCNHSFTKLSRMSIQELQRFNGIGDAKAITIHAAMELARRRERKIKVKTPKITSSKDVYYYLRSELSDLSHEEFYSLFLNRGNEVIGSSQISKGGISGTVADGKIIFHRALELKSSAVVLAHNHPSGQLKPSQSDLNLTSNLVNFGKYIDLPILDHVIFSDNNYFSFADEGLIV
ncbi:MAG: DNA repair protein RadC [Crocinitomicaceae bacterium]|nr:DNA repair protein RadC [Crocinitomicaceae bacterium]